MPFRMSHHVRSDLIGFVLRIGVVHSLSFFLFACFFSFLLLNSIAFPFLHGMGEVSLNFLRPLKFCWRFSLYHSFVPPCGPCVSRFFSLFSSLFHVFLQSITACNPFVEPTSAASLVLHWPVGPKTHPIGSLSNHSFFPFLGLFTIFPHLQDISFPTHMNR